ncbi:MAG: PAS domain S-box protein, partial [Bacteroidetes bacterium]|nr:PAS domain S-box protein [Bacteroidota bacterium]
VKNGEIIGTQSLERDVTERKHAEEELIKSEQSFIGLFNSSSEAIYIQDANGAFLNVNDGAVKMYGYSREEFIGRTPDFLSAPGRNNMNQVLEILNNVFFTGGSEQFDFWGRRKNGEIFPKEVIVQRGNYFGKTVIITTARDITERKKAEEALVEKENRLQTILNSEPECVKLTGPDGVVTEMNPAGLEMIEADHLDEVKGKSVFSLINEPFRKPYIQLTEDVFHGKPGTLEFEFTTLKGNRRWMEMHAVPLKDAEGKIISLLSISRDSTERRKTENALIQSELRYRTLIEHASDGIFIFDDEGNFSDVNSSASHLTGYSHDELLNMDIKDIVFEEDLETNPVRMQELKAGETVVRERRLRRKDGTALAVEINSKKLPDGRYVGMARDIQERKKIENKLVENETRLKEAQRLALIGSWDSDLINDHIKWSDEVYRIFGLEPQEFKATYQAFLEHVHPDDRSFLNESYNKSIKEKSRFDIVHRIVMKDQSIKYVNEKCETFYDETGKAIRSIGTVQDITERKKAEDEIKLSQERFRTLYEENPLMNFTLDKKGNILSVNKRGAKELEYTPDELIGKPVFRIFHAEDHEKVLLQIQKCISTPRQSFSWEMSQLTRSGCTIWVSETGTALPDEHGNYLVMVVCENVTERKKTEEELHQMNEQLRYLSSHLQSIREEERANIAREIHDELGQQLTGLKMDASWLNKKIPAEDKISHDKIKDMISLLDETVKTVRRISTELRPSILDDLGLVDALDWQSSEFEKRTGIHCRFKSTSAEMQLDKNLSTGIFRVYQETLTNIARHAEATEIKTFFELSDQHAILMIRDNGKGFDEAEIKNKHTLGLTGMKERAIMFGGKLTIESSKGKGTAILLRVPLKISPGNIIL